MRQLGTVLSLSAARHRRRARRVTDREVGDAHARAAVLASLDQPPLAASCPPDAIAQHPNALTLDTEGTWVLEGASWPAIAAALAALARLRANPRLDVELSLPEQGRVAVRPILLLADPVMTPAQADEITDALRFGAPQQWTPRLAVNDHGDLQWQLDGSAATP
ncbi:hypothetical protein [Mycobacterium heckeshornense]|uniref:hypothetical protein n=1 Tax=Mycobacterium heckeshornense TaxID=110505 RepID=UPI000662B6FE|nr:hypothetical protein [Mycobacterium heckeshornense]KMV22097.1 hypothetical protein ACT16_13370 [Mycobacterium heckeshornense]